MDILLYYIVVCIQIALDHKANRFFLVWTNQIRKRGDVTQETGDPVSNYRGYAKGGFSLHIPKLFKKEP